MTGTLDSIGGLFAAAGLTITAAVRCAIRLRSGHADAPCQWRVLP